MKHLYPPKYSLLVVLLWVSLTSFAQQDPMFTQYMFNTLAVNPAYAGNRERLSITALGRVQWVGIEGAPTTQTITIDSPIPFYNIGVGLNVVNDQIGVFRNLHINGYYSYTIQFKKNKPYKLSLGLQAGFTQLGIDLLSVQHSADPFFYDQTFGNNIRRFLPNFGAGIFYHSKRFYVGLSAPKLINHNIGNATANTQAIAARQYRHYFLMAGYVFDVGTDIKLKPSTLLKYVEGSPLELDINANIWFFDLLGFGLSYRTGDSIDGMIEIMPSRALKIGYAYDWTLTELNRYNSGSHEIMLRYEWGFGNTKILTPRYF